MSYGPIIGVAVGAAFIGKGAYELIARRAFGKIGPIERRDYPGGYWIVVGTSLAGGAIMLCLSIRRLGLM